MPRTKTGGRSGMPPKTRADEARKRQTVDPSTPKATTDVIKALNETVKAAEWLRKPDSVSVAMLRSLLAQMKAEPALAPRLMPMAITLAINLGFTPEARTRLALELEDRKPPEKRVGSPKHAAAKPVAFDDKRSAA